MTKEKEVKKLGTNPTYAAALSFFVVGGGQIYNRQLKKFVALFVAYYGLVFVGLLTLIFLIGFVFLFGAVALWLYSIYDAYNEANRER